MVLGEAERLHQVDPSEEFVGAVDAVEVLSQDVEEVRQAGARTDEHAVDTAVEQLVDGDGLADEDVQPDVHTHLPQLVDLRPHDLLRQAELRDAVDEHAAGLVEGLVDPDLVAAPGQLARG